MGNVTQMWRSRDCAKTCSMPVDHERRSHDEAVATLRSLRGHAREAERVENGHCHRRCELERHNLHQQHLTEQSRVLPGLRTAGLGSVNPRLGTSGSLPDLSALRGSGGMDKWRHSTPWALDGD